MADDTTQDDTSEQVAAAALTVTTDQADYAPGSIATFTAENVAIGGTVTFDVDHVLAGADGIIGTADDTLANDLSGLDAFIVTDGGAGDLDNVANGTIVTSWNVNEDAANQAFVLTATDTATGQSASVPFTDAAPVNAIPTTLNGTIFVAAETPTTGSGVINSFLRIHDDPTEEGFNTDFRPAPLDTDTTHTFNHHIMFADIPLVDANGNPYTEDSEGPAYLDFRLDLNELNSPGEPPISLDALRIYSASTGDLSTLDDATLIYELGGTVELNDWNDGSGKGDYIVRIPLTAEQLETLQADNPFIYLYSDFGDPDVTDGGFEEWYVIANPNPSIEIVKITGDGPDGAVVDGDGVTLTEGDTVVWTYSVTNTGNVDLKNVVVTDDHVGVNPQYVSGDDGPNGIPDGILSVGETWVYTATGTAIDTSGLPGGDYDNIGTVNAIYDAKGNDDIPVTDSDPSSYNAEGGGGGGQDRLDIAKTTTDTFETDGQALVDAGNILVGHSILWTYEVTNGGDFDLENVVVHDDKIAGDITSFTGDVGNDGVLSVGETWTFTATGEAEEGEYENTAYATADRVGTGEDVLSDEESSNYFGAAPDIAIDKTTQDLGADGLDAEGELDPNDGQALDDAGNILVGHVILWTYTVTNTGNVALSNVTVTDDHGTVDDGINNGIDNFDEKLDDIVATYVSGDDNSNDLLDLDETWIFTATGSAIADAYSNTATAEGSFTDTALHTETVDAEDTSSYFGADPEINIVKVTVAGSESGDDLNIVAGTPITWKYTVTNTGNVALENIEVTDDQGVTPVLNAALSTGEEDGVLDLDDVWVYTASGTAVEGPYSNTGTATGDFTDTAGHETTVDDDDDSGYQGWHSGALTQGFWGTHTEAWDANSANTNKWGQLVPNVLKSTDINPRTDGQVMLGDVNGDGLANDTNNLLISYDIAKAILSSSTTGDARIIMLQQAIAAQLNIWNGEAQPFDLITEAVNWLTKEGSWSGNTFDLDVNNDSILDGTTTFEKNGSIKKLASADPVSTSGANWQGYIDVDGGLGSTQANGEGLKNALMWFNQGQLITDGNEVGWSDGVTVDHIHDNTVLDNFWLTLGQQDAETDLKGIIG